MNKRKFSIRTRIFSMVVVLMIILFGMIIAVFNVFIEKYVQDNVKEQLNTAVEIGERTKKIQPANHIITEIEIFHINADFTIEFNEYLDNNDELQAILNKALEKNKTFENFKNVHLITQYGNYYTSVIESVDTDGYTCFYVDVTGIVNFGRTINTLLIMIMIIGAMLSFVVTAFLAYKITKSIKTINKFAFQIGNGDFTQVKFNFQDIELHDLFYNLNQAARKLEKFDKEQKIFFGNASHELRTPLMSIKSYAEGIQYGVIETEVATKIIIEETDRLAEMVEDLLYISKIDNITKDYVKNRYDLREILKKSVERQEMIAKNKDIIFNLKFDTKPVMFNCNEKFMDKAFTNLISNAIRYAKKEINIICKIQQRKIIIIIQDDGEGVLPENSEKIFERFFKGDNGNHGIGLSMVKTIVEQNNGKIYVDNSKQGANFIVEFNIV